MIMSAIVIVLVVVVGYIWASRGFFSSMVNMLCVLIAGAVALGVWEPLSYMVLTKMGGDDWVLDMAWGACLALPFAVVLSILRLATNKLLPANADLDGVSNLVGGGVCGLVAGTVSVGIVVISVSFLRVGQEFAGVEAEDLVRLVGPSRPDLGGCRVEAVDVDGQDCVREQCHRALAKHDSVGHTQRCPCVVRGLVQPRQGLFLQQVRPQRIDHPLAISSERDLPVYVCRSPTIPLALAWPSLRNYTHTPPSDVTQSVPHE